jgi:hypothetical protein
MDLPVLVLAYNRPSHLEKCLNALVKLGSYKIYVSQDGKSDNGSSEWIKTKTLIQSFYEKGLVVKYRTLESNLGTLEGVQSGINWFFDQEKLGLIIEDDLVLHHHALNNAVELFGLMAIDNRIGAVCLYPALPKIDRNKLAPESFRFSVFSNSLAWGTTAQKWNQRIDQISPLTAFNSVKYLLRHVGVSYGLGWLICLIEEILLEKKGIKTKTKRGNWDVRWTNTLFVRNWLTVVLNTNSVENIGWDDFATHSKIPTKWQIQEMTLDPSSDNWVLPNSRVPNRKMDRLTMRNFHLMQKLRSLVQLRTRIRVRILNSRRIQDH